MPTKTASTDIATADTPVYRALEPRIAFDAALVATLDQVATDHQPTAVTEPTAAPSPALTHAETRQLAEALASDGGVAQPASVVPGSAIVFIDSAVTDPAVIAAAAPQGAEIVMIDHATDGLAQIAAHLASRTDISAIHIVSHGSEGRLDLGNGVLDAASMQGEHFDDLATIGRALSADADILVYGCYFGAGKTGAEAVALLSGLTGADVAASEDATGGVTNADWVLEQQSGDIEAYALAADQWEHALAPLLISANTPPVINLGTANETIFTGVGTVITWQNAGTVGGLTIDLRATVTAFSGTASPTFHIGNVAAGTVGDNPGVFLWSAGSMTLRWEVYEAGTNNLATGTPEFRITDIDGIGGAPNTREVVAPSLDGLSSYTVSSPSNLLVTTSAGGVSASGTQNQGGEPTSLVGFQWNEVSSWSVTYNNYVANAYFSHDGDGEFAFTAPATTYMLQLDLDADNSTATGTSNQATFTEGGTAVRVVDLDAAITQNTALGTSLGSATITLTNAQTDDRLLVNGSAAASGTVAGLSYTIASSGGQITVTLSGSGSVATYEAALKAITFENTNEAPSSVDRKLDLSVTNTTFGTTSSVALSTIHVVPANDAWTAAIDTASTFEDTPLIVPAATGLLSNDGDVDGDALSITGFSVAGIAGTFTSGTTANIPSVGSLVINADGSYTFTPAINYHGTVPLATYTVSDGHGGTDTATLEISVTPVNDSPTVGVDTGSVTEDTTLTVPAASGLLANDSDFEGNTPLAVTQFTVAGVAGTFTAGSPVTIPGVGALTINANGSYTFAPLPDYAGTIPVATYTVADSVGATSTSTLTLAMTPVNDPPNLDLDGITPSTGYETTFTEDGPAVAIATIDAAVTDIDDSLVESAVVVLTNAQAGDILSISGSLPVGISSSIDTSVVGQVTVTLTGSAIKADYATALNTIRFSNTSDTPDTTDRNLTVTVNDGALDSNTAIATVHVVPVNDAPADDNETASVTEDTTLSVPAASGLLANTTDPDGAAPSVTDFAIAGESGPFVVGTPYAITGVGSFTLNADGSYAFTPAADYIGTIPAITYTVVDGNGGTDTSTLSLAIVPVNDAPQAIADGPAAVTEDTPTTGNVLTNDVDIDGDTLTVTQVSIPGGGVVPAGQPAVIPGVGTLVVEANGSYTFTPDPNYVGPIPSATYTITDGSASSNATLTFADVAPVNDAPVDGNEAVDVIEDTPLTVSAASGLLANATDVDGGTPAITDYSVVGIAGPQPIGSPVTIPGVGVLTINADGSYMFAPASNYDGAVPVVTYTISDGNGGTDTSSLTLVMVPVNDAPNAINDGVTTPPSSGPVLNVGGGFESLPGATNPGAPLSPYNFGATDWTATNTDGETLIAETGRPAYEGSQYLSLLQNAGQNPGTAWDESSAIFGGYDRAVTLVNVIPGQTYTISFAHAGDDRYGYTADTTLVQIQSMNTAQQQSNTFATPGTFNWQQQSVTFTADAGTTQIALLFSSMGAGNSSAMLDAVTVTQVIPGTASAYVTPEDTAFSLTPLANDSDPDGDAIHITHVEGQPITPGGATVSTAHGTVGLSADGLTFTFTPALDYNGPANFAYTIADPSGLTSTATVLVTVTPINDAPVDNNESVDATEDTTLTVPAATGLLANSTDVDGGAPVITGYTIAGIAGAQPLGSAVTIPGVGALTINADGSYAFAPAANYAGSVPVVTYTVSDTNGGTDTSTLALVMVPVNDAPVANDTAATTPEDAPINATLPIATDVEGSALIYGLGATLPTHGIVLVNADGSYVYTPAANYNGPDSFTYTVTDGTVTVEKTVTITVTPVNDAPVAVDTSATTPEDASINGTLPVATDVDADPLTYALGASSPVHGTVLVNPDGSYVYTPSANYNGPDSFTYTVTDGTVTIEKTVTITVTPINDAPAAQNDAASLSEDAPLVTGNVITSAPGEDTDVDGEPLSVATATQGANALVIGQPFATAGGGVLTLNADGSYTFAPGTAYNGLDVGESASETVRYAINDGNGGTATALLVITINGANDAPVMIDRANPGSPGNPTPAADPLNVIPDVTRNDGQPLTPIIVGHYVVDPDGEPLTFALSPSAPAWLSIDPATGEITGTPPADASQQSNTGNSGEYLITVTATDPDGVSVTTTVTLAIVNVAPVAAIDTASISEDSAPISGSVLDNDRDGSTDSDPIRVGGVISGTATPISGVGLSMPVAGDQGGTFTVAPNGAYTFDPSQSFQDLAPGETRTTTVTYVIYDDNGGSSTAELSVTMTGTNDAPQLIDPATGLPVDPATSVLPTVSAQDGTPIVPVSVASYFADVDISQGPPTLSVDVSALPDGIAFDVATGTFSGTPTRDASQGHTSGDPAGTYRVSVTATDPTGASVTTIITFTVVNLAPIAHNDAVTTSENAPLTGSVFDDNGSGPDLDGGLDTDTLQIGGVITGNATPTAGIGINAPVTGSGGGTFVVQADGSYTFSTGTSFDDLAPGETRTTTITYLLTDGNGGTDTAILTITVTGTNDVPQVIDPSTGLPVPGLTDVVPRIFAQDGTPITPLAIATYFRDLDVSQGAPILSVTPVDLPPGITFDPATGTFSGTPTHNASQGHSIGQPVGTYRIPVTATDSLGASVTTTITIKIGNPAPVATDDAVHVSEDGPVIIGNVLRNDRDGGNDTDPLAVVGAVQGGVPLVVGQPFTTSGGGMLTLNADGSYSFDQGTAYNSLPLGQTATETIRYTISDGNGGTATATLTIAIRGENDGPVVDPLRVLPPVTASDGATPAPVDVGAIIRDPDGEPLVFTATGLPPGLDIDPRTGLITGTLPSDASQHGPYTVIVTATDPHGAVITTQVVYNIYNPAPVATDDTGQVDRGQETTFAVLANDTDGSADRDALTVVVASAQHGTVVINADGTATYKPDWGFEGTDTIRYRISDGNGGFADAVVRLVISSDPTTGLNEKVETQEQRATTQSPEQPRTVKGIVLDAVKALGARFTSSRTGVDGIVLDTVRDLTTADNSDRGRSASGSDIAGLSNFSLMLSSANAESSVAIETFVRNRVLIIQLGTSGFFGGSDAVEWKVQRIDGRPLPEWLSFAGRSVLMGERSANAEVLDLRVTAILPDGSTVSREVRVHAPTGELQPLHLGKQGSLAPRPFWETIPVEQHLQRAEIEALGSMLQAAE